MFAALHMICRDATEQQGTVAKLQTQNQERQWMILIIKYQARSPK